MRGIDRHGHRNANINTKHLDAMRNTCITARKWNDNMSAVDASKRATEKDETLGLRDKECNSRGKSEK